MRARASCGAHWIGRASWRAIEVEKFIRYIIPACYSRHVPLARLDFTQTFLIVVARQLHADARFGVMHATSASKVRRLGRATLKTKPLLVFR